MPRKSPPNKHNWTDNELNFIRSHWDELTNKQLADKLGLKITMLRMKLYEMGLKRMELEYWTEEQVKYLKANYKKIGDVELAEIFQKKWPKNKIWSKKHIEKKRKYLKLNRTPAQQLVVEKRNLKNGRWKICNFKRWLATGITPVGELRIWTNDNDHEFVVIKLKGGFVHFAPWLYKQLNGPIPKGYMVSFRDGNQLNVTPDNLLLINRQEHACRMRAKTQGALSDNYIVGLLAHGKPELKKVYAEDKDLIELKRLQITLNRAINGQSNRKETAKYAE